MKKIEFYQDLNIGYEVRDKFGNEIKEELWSELYWNLKRPIRIVASY